MTLTLSSLILKSFLPVYPQKMQPCSLPPVRQTGCCPPWHLWQLLSKLTLLHLSRELNPQCLRNHQDSSAVSSE
ncbi:hypothetical protein AOXY_G37445 [Acipenser oxyrinchus oxyrinchus]|uniref:Uncharacterized protein n=1 Tax=Acipenser oxyrinchus oxyrinchus TaxID=40147 RepID=A0AAD8CG46_ACIOX|nr:hypothetical protein AOXY_G37445 [Acipenser oxyrinchus oxyrinchus]